MPTNPGPVLQPRFRVKCGEDIAIGPGKADLLQRINATGSIAVAAQQLGMSYMRAWTLVKTMNQCFREPLVLASRGGKAHGGAVLTETGRRVLELYARLQAASREAADPVWRELRPLLTAR